MLRDFDETGTKTHRHTHTHTHTHAHTLIHTLVSRGFLRNNPMRNKLLYCSYSMY